MNRSLFRKLACDGIRKNRKLYIPYILSCIGTIALFYILCSLSVSPALKSARGGSNLGLFLSLGKFVIGLFAFIFLFYTNSFLIRRRYKEFGLFHVLGMDKHGISRILLWESVIVTCISLVFGILLGAVFAKLCELGLLMAIGAEVTYGFFFSAEPIRYTLLIFIPVFALLLGKSILQLKRSKPLDLVKSENYGEKPPRVNWVLAALGVIVLAAAYWMSVSIQSPLATILTFFVAVMMVIAATYLLFIAGSVAVCRILKNNKGYYYQKSHFVSVSSMAYRMKRNGAGLASICILSTMVLVMVSSSASLYFGKEDALRSQYPRDNQITVYFESIESFTDENIAAVRSSYEAEYKNTETEPADICENKFAMLTGLLERDHLYAEAESQSFLLPYDNLRTLFFVSEADYNRATGAGVSLTENEALLKTESCAYANASLTIGDVTLMIRSKVSEYPEIPNDMRGITPFMLLVVKDYDILKPLMHYRTADMEFSLLELQYRYGYNIDTDTETAQDLLTRMSNAAMSFDFLKTEDGAFRIMSGCLSASRDDFYGTFGALFFLGIILSVLFIFAAAIIIYYKQVSEGYEDMTRFSIMQKVGMTKEDIKKSINSQVLTVFFAPLAMSCLHLAFAFPPIWKMLQLFNLHNLGIVIPVTVGSVLVFAAFYAVIYKLTARAYYKIVSTGET